jgi:hypothetical protein
MHFCGLLVIWYGLYQFVFLADSEMQYTIYCHHSRSFHLCHVTEVAVQCNMKFQSFTQYGKAVLFLEWLTEYCRTVGRTEITLMQSLLICGLRGLPSECPLPVSRDCWCHQNTSTSICLSHLCVSQKIYWIPRIDQVQGFCLTQHCFEYFIQ